MCLIVFAYRAHPDFPLVVAANRDEYYERPTEPGHFWESKSVSVFAGKDVQAGGMWMGVAKSGKFAAVTNYREASEEVTTSSSKKKSRGSLVADFLKSSMPALEYLEQAEPESSLYSGFSLVIGDCTGLYYFSNRGDQRHAPSTVRKLEPGRVYCLCNRLLDDPWPKVQKSKDELSKCMENMTTLSEDKRTEALHSILMDTTKAQVHQLPTKETGCSEEVEKFLSSLFIESQSYGTRAASVIVMSAPIEQNQQGATCAFTEFSYGKGGKYLGKVAETFDVTSPPGGGCPAT